MTTKFFDNMTFRLLFQLYYPFLLAIIFVLASCGGGGSGGESNNISDNSPPVTAACIGDSNQIPTPTADVMISGAITFDFIPHDTLSNGLDYSSVSVEPARGVEVVLVNQNNVVINSTITDENGVYFLIAPGSNDVCIRVNARMLATGSPSWNFSVTDNTQGNALYVLQGNLVNSGTTNSIRNLHASAGWGGSSYTAARSAAPFAILDTVYEVIQLVLSENPNTNFPDAELRWSTRNNPSPGSLTDGDIDSSFYLAGNIYLLGDENNDTDEYDRHVIAHELGHYFEDQFSRSDSMGGEHEEGDRLDMRVAFSEGFGNAFSAIVLGDPVYRDSLGNDQSLGFTIDVEDNGVVNPGWYSEASIQSILYDIYDANNDGADTINDGFKSIYTVLTSASYRDAAQLTSAHLFFNELKLQFPGLATHADTLIAAQDFVVNDAVGNGETNSAGSPLVLPLYDRIIVSGASVEVCSINNFGLLNKLGNRQFVSFSVGTTGNYTISARRSSGLTASDPDILLWQNGDLVAFSEKTIPNSELLILTLDPGNYIAEVYEYENLIGPGGNVCFDVTVN